MHFIRRVLTAVIALVLCVSLTPRVHAAGTASDLIQEMVLAYGYNRSAADSRVESLLDQLEAIDYDLGTKWRNVMAYWRYANADMPINSGYVPGDLINSSGMCIVVLGYALNSDGSIRDELRGRLQAALEAANLYPSAYVLCTGGGTASKNKSTTEADQMAKWLMDNGLDPNRVIVENRSYTTGQNAINSYRILRDCFPQVDQVMIASSDYHIPWGAVLFETQFILAGSAYGQPIRVVSNTAYPTATQLGSLYRYQTAGILEIAGLGAAAAQVYNNTMKVPKI